VKCFVPHGVVLEIIDRFVDVVCTNNKATVRAGLTLVRHLNGGTFEPSWNCTCPESVALTDRGWKIIYIFAI